MSALQNPSDPYGWLPDDYDEPEGCIVHATACTCDEEPDDWWDRDPLTGRYGEEW